MITSSGGSRGRTSPTVFGRAGGKGGTTIDTLLEGAFFSLLIGLLFGLERERSKHAEALFAGIRTFPLLSLSGYLAGLAGGRGMPWVLPVVLLIVGGLISAPFHSS